MYSGFGKASGPTEPPKAQPSFGNFSGRPPSSSPPTTPLFSASAPVRSPPRLALSIFHDCCSHGFVLDTRKEFKVSIFLDFFIFSIPFRISDIKFAFSEFKHTTEVWLKAQSFVPNYVLGFKGMYE